jgi:hypothetical protein
VGSFMKLFTAVSFVTFALFALAVLSPADCFAQRDPEAAARQAEIDADEAQSKIESLQQEQIAAADVQNENTAEMAARDNEIHQYEDQELAAERRLRNAERE